MDIERAKEYMADKPPVCFSLQDTFSEEFFTLFKLNGSSKIKNMFKGQESNSYKLYKSIIKCDNCEKEIICNVSKTKLIDMGVKFKKNGQYGIYCDTCVNIKKEKLKLNQAEYEKIKEDNSVEFINLYLNPNNSWKDRIKTKYFYDFRDDYYKANNKKIIEFIKSMPYELFLKTPYWKIISWKIKQENDFSCEICNSQELLVAHHRTYKNHGIEIEVYKKDLTCLCKNCHEKYHKKDNKNE